jgi:hypothetical protein
VYDVSLDGRRVLMSRDSGGGETPRLVVVETWFEELERLVPTN